jgi:hypothetical protein
MVIFRARRANSKIDFWGGMYSDTIPVRNRFFNRKSAIIGDRSSRLHEISGLASTHLGKPRNHPAVI